jgi:hypothetical protein
MSVNVFETAITMAKIHEDLNDMILDEVTPQFVPGRRSRVSSPPIEASNLSVDVFETAITMVVAGPLQARPILIQAQATLISLPSKPHRGFLFGKQFH